MKLRIRGNSLRFRLTQTEVGGLAKKIPVEEKTEFGNGQILIYSIASSAQANSISACFNDGKIEVLIPEGIANGWAESEAIGLSAEQPPLEIIIEKDFACLKTRNSREDADTFPNPFAGASC